MEAFEHICKVALETEGFTVSNNVKFFVKRRTKKTAYEEWQTHGYEVDLVGTRRDRLVLASCKSYFGSPGVRPAALQHGTKESSGYRMLVDEGLRASLMEVARDSYGYESDPVEFRLYAGRLVRGTESECRRLADDQDIKLVELPALMDTLLKAAEPKTYINDPVIMTVKALKEAGHLP